MHMASNDSKTRRELNAYLACEFGLEEGETSFAEDEPFRLVLVHTFALENRHYQVFEFNDDGERFYAIDKNGDHAFLPESGMTPADLEIQIRGSRWIADQMPVDGNTSLIGDETVPPAIKRRAHMRKMAIDETGLDEPVILEGVLLRALGEYLVLCQRGDGTAVAVSDAWEPIIVPFPQASAWRRLAYAVGKRLAKV
jgi:hypothetical protein